MKELCDHLIEAYEEIGTLKSKLERAERRIANLEQALERIADMSDSVYSKGAYCSKIAREALARSDKATALGRG